jgi:hypothetical protein
LVDYCCSAPAPATSALLAHRASAALTVGTGMLVLAFGLVVALIVRPFAGAGVPLAQRPVAVSETPAPVIEPAPRARARQ